MASKKKNATRRGNNEGTIYERSDGLWSAQVTVGYDDAGKRIRKSIYGKSRTEVAMKMNSLVSDVYKHGYKNDTKETFEILMRHWLMIYKKPEVASRTFEKIIGNCKRYVFPALGKFKLEEITSDKIQTLFANMSDKQKLCVDTIKKCKYVISQFFDYAVENKYVNFNPAEKTTIKSRDRDKSKEKEYKAIRKEDRAAFYEAICSHAIWKPLCLTGMFGGLRIGEVLALKWRNIDFEHGFISVENAITQVVDFNDQGDVIGRQTIIGDTKTVASERENPMPDILIEALKEYKERRMLEEALFKGKISLTKPDDIVFSNNEGELRTYWGTNTLFRRFLDKHGLGKKGIHFHTLRHTFSNMLFEANENPKVVQMLMGHKNVTTTMIYNSVDKRQLTSAKNILNKIGSDME